MAKHFENDTNIMIMDSVDCITFMQICKESIISLLTLPFQDLCKMPRHAGKQLLDHILMDGSQFLKNECLEIVIICEAFFVHPPLKNSPQVLNGLENVLEIDQEF